MDLLGVPGCAGHAGCANHNNHESTRAHGDSRPSCVHATRSITRTLPTLPRNQDAAAKPGERFGPPFQTPHFDFSLDFTGKTTQMAPSSPSRPPGAVMAGSMTPGNFYDWMIPKSWQSDANTKSMGGNHPALTARAGREGGNGVWSDWCAPTGARV